MVKKACDRAATTWRCHRGCEKVPVAPARPAVHEPRVVIEAVEHRTGFHVKGQQGAGKQTGWLVVECVPTRPRHMRRVKALPSEAQPT